MLGNEMKISDKIMEQVIDKVWNDRKNGKEIDTLTLCYDLLGITKDEEVIIDKYLGKR